MGDEDFKSVYKRLKETRDKLYKKKKFTPVSNFGRPNMSTSDANFNPPIQPRSMGTWTDDISFEQNRVRANEEARAARKPKRGRKPGSRNRRTDNGTNDNSDS